MGHKITEKKAPPSRMKLLAIFAAQSPRYRTFDRWFYGMLIVSIVH
jgi:hypothetical protein